MSTFANTLSERERRRGRLHAYFACYFGCISEVMLDSSAIIILYVGMLGGNSSRMMLVTTFTGLLGMATMIPCAAIIERIGMRKSVVISCLTACAGFLLMAAAPYFGAVRLPVALAGCFLYCMQRALYGVAWYPMLDAFLRPEDRGSFFGTMRWTYLLLSWVIFFGFGKMMGKEPPLWMMQTIIAVTGLLVLGRLFCILQFPEDTGERPRHRPLREALSIAIHNGSLTGYSVYVCLFNFCSGTLIPLSYVYLKEYVKLGADQVQIFSTVLIAGSAIGYFTYGFLLRRLKIKRMELLVHLLVVGVALTFFAVGKENAAVSLPICGSFRIGNLFHWIIGIAYFCCGFSDACYRCNNSSEMLALATPGNKPMASAFLQTYQYAGNFFSRFLSTLILGAGMLAPTWELGGRTVSRYQSIFLACGVLGLILLLVLPTLPSMVSHRQDYYDEMR